MYRKCFFGELLSLLLLLRLILRRGTGEAMESLAADTDTDGLLARDSVSFACVVDVSTSVCLIRIVFSGLSPPPELTSFSSAGTASVVGASTSACLTRPVFGGLSPPPELTSSSSAGIDVDPHSTLFECFASSTRLSSFDDGTYVADTEAWIGRSRKIKAGRGRDVVQEKIDLE